MIRQARSPSVSEPEPPAVEPRMVDAQSTLGNEALKARLLPDTSLKAPTGAGVGAARLGAPLSEPSAALDGNLEGAGEASGGRIGASPPPAPVEPPAEGSSGAAPDGPRAKRSAASSLAAPDGPKTQAAEATASAGVSATEKRATSAPTGEALTHAPSADARGGGGAALSGARGEAPANRAATTKSAAPSHGGASASGEASSRRGAAGSAEATAKGAGGAPSKDDAGVSTTEIAEGLTGQGRGDPAYAASVASALRAEVTSAAESIRAQGELEATQILDAAAMAEAKVLAAQASQLSRISASFDGASASLEALLATALGQVDAQASADRAAVTASVAAHRASATQATQAAITSAITDAQAEAQRPAEIGVTEGARGAAEVQAAADHARSTAQGLAGSYAGADHGDVMMEAALEVGEGTAQEVEGKAGAIQSEAQSRGAARAESNAASVSALAAQLDGVLPALDSSMSTLEASALAEVDKAADQARAKVNQLGEERRAALSGARASALAAVTTRGDEAAAKTSADGAAAASQARDAAEDGATRVESIGERVAEGMELAEAPDPTLVDALFADGGEALDEAEAQILTALGVEGAASKTALADSAQAQSAALTEGDPNAALSALVQDARAQASAVVNGQAEANATALGALDAGAAEAESTALGSVQGALSDTLATLTAENDAFALDLGADVDAATMEAVAPAQDVSNRAAEAASRAAAEADQPWWKDALGALWEAVKTIAKGLLIFVALTVVIFAIAVLIVGAAISAKVLAICALIAGVILTVGALVMGVVQRMGEGYGFFAALGLSVCDLIGLTQLYEAFTGDDTHSDRTLTDEERWQRGFEGTFGVVMTLLGIRAMKGARGAKPKPLGGLDDAPTTPKDVDAPKTGDTPETLPTDKSPDGPGEQGPTPNDVDAPRAGDGPERAPTDKTPEPTPGERVEDGVGAGRVAPRTLEELRSALSDQARRGFDQQRQTMSDENFHKLTDAFKDSEGRYDVARAERELGKRAVDDAVFDARLRQRDAHYTKIADTFIKKIRDTCDETDGTNRPNATIGDGTTEAALRHETTTGTPVGGKGHAAKCSDSITALRGAISKIEGAKPFITDAAKLSESDKAITRARPRISAMEPALDAWNNRVADYPDVWNPDGSSKVTPGFP